MHQHSKQSGFAAIEAVLVLVIIGIVGGTGYFVWHAKQNTNKSLQDAANSQPALQTKQKTPAAPVTSKVNTEEAIVDVIQDDGSVRVQTASAIAKTDDQIGVLKALRVHCTSLSATDNYVVVNYKIFTQEGLYVQDGGYAKINAGCGPKTTTFEDIDGSGAILYLHRLADKTWVFDVGGQMSPGCSSFDGKGYPASLVPSCIDNSDGITTRRPR